MESKPFIKMVQRAVVAAVQAKPVLPTCIWDVEPEKRPFCGSPQSPPTSPCTEVVVVADGPQMPKYPVAQNSSARAVAAPLESFVLIHPTFSV